MSLQAHYQSDAGRWLEILCGLALTFFSLLIAVGAVLLVAWSHLRLGALVLGAALGLIAWALLWVAMRLLRGQRNLNQTLLPPMGLLVGALIFLVGGIGLLVIGIVERDVKPLLGGIGILPASYYALRLAKERRRAAVTPNNSLERSR